MFSRNDLAQTIKAHRKRLGLTQAELAKKVGVSSQTISAYESENEGGSYGEQKSKLPVLDKAAALANIFGISLDALCGNDKVSAQLSNMSDIIDYINVLGEYFTCSIKAQELPLQTPPDCSGHDENGNPILEYGAPGVVIEIHSSDLAKYIENRNKMLKLVKEDTINSDDYKSWRDSRKRELEEKPLKNEVYGVSLHSDLVECNEPLLPESWLYRGE